MILLQKSNPNPGTEFELNQAPLSFVILIYPRLSWADHNWREWGSIDLKWFEVAERDSAGP